MIKKGIERIIKKQIMGKKIGVERQKRNENLSLSLSLKVYACVVLSFGERMGVAFQQKSL